VPGESSYLLEGEGEGEGESSYLLESSLVVINGEGEGESSHVVINFLFKIASLRTT